METQKKKVVSREFNKEWSNNMGTFYSFLVKFEGDETVYGYNSKSRDPKFFSPGEEQEYTSETKEYDKKDGTKGQFTIVKPHTEKQMFAGKSFNPEHEKLRQKIASPAYALSYVKDLVIAGKVPMDDAASVAKEWSDFIRLEIESAN